MNILHSSCRLFCLGAMIILTACSGSRSSVSSNREDPSMEVVDKGYDMSLAQNANQSNIKVEPNKNNPSNLSLSQMIQRLPGVKMQGGGAVISGAGGSFMSDTRALFVVDGRSIGKDFAVVDSFVDPKKVVTVSVLKGADATIYGSRGSNGVILIRTVK